MRFKLFKWYLFKNGFDYDLYIPSTKAEVDATIKKIKERHG